MWVRVVDMVKTGRALMVYRANNEQGLAFKVHKHDWVPTDHEGLTLMLRPSTTDPTPPHSRGWSTASRRRRYGKGTT